MRQSDKDRRWEDDRVRAALHHASVMVVNGVRCRYTRNSENIRYCADLVVQIIQKMIKIFLMLYFVRKNDNIVYMILA